MRKEGGRRRKNREQPCPTRERAEKVREKGREKCAMPKRNGDNPRKRKVLGK